LISITFDFIDAQKLTLRRRNAGKNDQNCQTVNNATPFFVGKTYLTGVIAQILYRGLSL
jgi:hypothetical protein